MMRRLFPHTFVCLICLTCLATTALAAGSTARKSSLVKTTQISGKETNTGKDFVSPLISCANHNNGVCCRADLNYKKLPKDQRKFTLQNKNKSMAQLLKQDLLCQYDAKSPPQFNHKQTMHIAVGITYRQVLDLDEKNQVLKSLIWFRLQWKDIHFKWEPNDYDGVDQIELPHSSVWMPDIVIYEEIGTHAYTPRLGHVQITHDGNVVYKEPAAFETSCSIDTSFFPFDMQVCHITFTSWTQPVTHIDLVSSRSQKMMIQDTKNYFINSGEWELRNILVTKKIRNYRDLVSPQNKFQHAQPSNASGTFSFDQSKQDNYSSTSSHSVTVLNSATVHINSSSMVGNQPVTDYMFSELSFSIAVKRNSSLYMQSMLFPSIILTTVALLGFYLPPESGERIGLQITILLTFMVFLLAVGEMFPASTGPYLGLYFVMCMSLLGVNLFMTVMILHIHFKPVVIENYRQTHQTQVRKRRSCGSCMTQCFGCRADTEQQTLEKSKQADLLLEQRKKKPPVSAVPLRMRKFLQLLDRCWSLGEDGARWMRPITDESLLNSIGHFSSDDDDDSSSDNRSRSSEAHDEKAFVATKEKKISVTTPDAHDEIQITTVSGKKSPVALQDTATKESVELERLRRASSVNSLDRTSISSCNPSTTPTRRSALIPGQSVSDINAVKKTFRHDAKIHIERPHMLKHRMLSVLSDLKGHIGKNEDTRKKRRKARRLKRLEALKRQKEEAQERQDLEQEEWKSVARAVDIICFRIYVMLITASHFVFFGSVYMEYVSDSDLKVFG